MALEGRRVEKAMVYEFSFPHKLKPLVTEKEIRALKRRARVAFLLCFPLRPQPDKSALGKGGRRMGRSGAWLAPRGETPFVSSVEFKENMN